METLGGCRERAGAEAVGAPCSRRAGQAPPPVPSPAPASPLLPTSSGQRALPGDPAPFRRDPPATHGLPRALWGHPSHPPCLTPGECPASITPCRSSTDFPRPFAPEEKKVTFVMASILPLPPHSCLEKQPTSCSSGCIFLHHHSDNA